MVRNSQHSQVESFWSVPYVILLVANLFQSMSSMMAGATIPLYADSLGAGPGLVGIIVGAFAFTALLVRPVAGPAFDAFSRKRLLMVAQGIIAASFLAFSFVTSPAAMLAVRLVHGIGIGTAGPLAMSLVSEYVPTSRLASGLSIYTLAQTVAQIIGPALGLWLIDVVGFAATYRIAAATLALSVVSILAVVEKPRQRLPYRLKLSRIFAREAADKAVVLALFYMAFGAANSYLVLYCTKLSIGSIGVYYTVYAVFLLATRPAYGRLAERIGSERALIPGVVFFVASYVVLANIHSFAGLMVVAALGALGVGASMPLLQALAMASVPLERRGAASNTTYTGLDVGTLIGPVVAGGLIEQLNLVTSNELVSYSLMWYTMVIPALVALVFILRWIRRARESEQEKQNYS